MRNIFAITVMVVLLATTGYGESYYIDGTSGLDTNPGTIASPWRTINKANNTLVAGDTVFLRGGTYTVNSSTPGIVPKNSGTNGNPIVYTIYENEIVNLVGQADIGKGSTGIWIHGKIHIKVDGKSLGQLNLSKMTMNLLIGPWPGNDPTGNSSYNEISYVYAYDSYRNNNWNWSWQGSLIGASAIYNHIHHCKFEKHGWLGDGTSDDEGNLFDLGYEQAATEAKRTYYNVIENNEFLHGGHATFGFFGDHNVVRNNYFHNEEWYMVNGILTGYRNIIGDGFPHYMGYSLFEGNRIGHAGPNYTFPGKTYYWGGTGMKLCHPYNILRYNSYFNNSSASLALGTYQAPFNAKGQYNYIYNNTFIHNGWYVKIPYPDLTYFDVVSFGYSGNGDWSVIYGNVVKNNLFYDNANTRSSSYDVWNCNGGSTLAQIMDPKYGGCTIENNFNSNAGENTDPLFIDETVSDPSSWTSPNLNLLAGSPAINQGTYLTQANGSGSSITTLIVDDARYFQDRNFGKGTLAWPSSVEIYADWIAIGTCENIVQIKSIDYSANTITLESPMTWQDKALIWLYKKSDGVQVLDGNGPDVGAQEYYQGGSQMPPKNLRIE